MNDHQAMRTILPLAAAGLLTPGELLTVEQHAAGCAACQRELEAMRLYSRGLRELPQPRVPAGLLQRTQARVIQEHDAAAGRRRHDVTIGVLTAFSWTVGIVFWGLVRMIAGDVWKVLGMNVADLVTWFWLSALLAWTTAGVAVVILGRRNELARRRS
jgi:anti-sigma factor RsiW